MQPTSRDGNAEIKRATTILKFELPALPTPPSPGHATVINLQYESGLRGPVLNFNNQIWFKMDHGSSSCNLDQADVIADGRNTEVKFHLPIGLFGHWDSQTQMPGWPHRSCVQINRLSETVAYFDHRVALTPQQFRIMAFCTQWCQSYNDPAPDHEILDNVVSDGSDLRFLISRIRRAFRETASEFSDKAIRKAAVDLVGELFPAKTPGIGYRLGRIELFQLS
ncbi:MAG: hypothetical protein WCT04_27515 [Planctomycetota bacterium]